jgi:antitoxin PrlF
MTTMTVSEKGQITLPIEIRRRLGLKPRSRVEFELRHDELILRRVKTVDELYGMFAEYARPGTTHEEEHEVMERAVAEEVTGE